jgi:hypothetical protein
MEEIIAIFTAGLIMGGFLTIGIVDLKKAYKK